MDVLNVLSQRLLHLRLLLWFQQLTLIKPSNYQFDKTDEWNVFQSWIQSKFVWFLVIYWYVPTPSQSLVLQFWCVSCLDLSQIFSLCSWLLKMYKNLRLLLIYLTTIIPRYTVNEYFLSNSPFFVLVICFDTIFFFGVVNYSVSVFLELKHHF